MTKKNIIITVITCAICSLAFFMIGFSIPREGAGSNEPGGVPSGLSEYAGLYIASIYRNGTEEKAKLYLFEDGSCNNPDEEKYRTSYSSCSWSMEGKRIRIYKTGAHVWTSCGIKEECERYLSSVNSGDIVKRIQPLAESDYGYGEDIKYVVISDSETFFDILDDGSLSFSDAIYVRRGSL